MSRIRRAERWRFAALIGLAAAGGCDAPLQIFSSASDSAARATSLTWFMIVLSGIIYVIVMAAMIVAMTRNRRRAASSVDMSDPGIRWIVIGGLVMPALVLAAVFVVAEAATGRYPEQRPVLTLHVTAHQWWWEVEYDLPDPTQRFKTANEIHIPAGQPVRIILTSADVIHSFWVPRLQGKLDVIPGDTNDLRLLARLPGVYRGVCQEFCGAQHANMGLIVFADDSASFSQWLGTQLADAPSPADSLTLMGQRLVVGGPCALCHTVRGTSALGQVAPDLTHVGSRTTIAAAMLPNTIGNLEAWIANAPALKPGTKMPTITLFDGQQLRAVAAYVASLK